MHPSTLLLFLTPVLSLAIASTNDIPTPSNDIPAPPDDIPDDLPTPDAPGTTHLARAASAAASILAEPIPPPAPEHADTARSCNLPGGKCFKAKRAARALGEAVAKASAAANPDIEFHWNHWCHDPGQMCTKVRRAAETIAEALAEEQSDVEKRDPEQKYHPGKMHWNHWCHDPGQMCQAKRDLMQAAGEAVGAL